MKIKLTESKLKNIISETIKKVLSEDYDNNAAWKEWIESQKKPLEELLNILKREGIESANISEYRSGIPCIGMYTDEYYEKKVYSIADKFATPRNMYVSIDSYPATTYIRLNQL